MTSIKDGLLGAFDVIHPQDNDHTSTDERIKFLKMWKDDVNAFAKAVRIPNGRVPGGRHALMSPTEFQKEILTQSDRGFHSVYAPRASGSTTAMAVKTLHRMIFHPRSTTMYLTATRRDAVDVFSMMRRMFFNLPEWFCDDYEGIEFDQSSLTIRNHGMSTYLCVKPCTPGSRS
jgi:hypothetical protein